MKMFRKTAAGVLERRSEWLADFENKVVTKRPDMTGKIEWDSPIFFFNEGLRIEDAVDLYIHRRPQNA